MLCCNIKKEVIVKKYFLRKWLKNYYALYVDKKTPTAEDIVRAVKKDLAT